MCVCNVPGYDGVKDFFPALLELIQQKLNNIPKSDVSEENVKLEFGLCSNDTANSVQTIEECTIPNGSSDYLLTRACQRDSHEDGLVARR